MFLRCVTTALGIVAVSLGTTALAYCPSSPSAKQEFKSSTVVFVGEVIREKEILETGNFIAGTYYTINVKEVLKGQPAQPTHLYSENTSGRFPMEIGLSYLVFASPELFEGLKTPQLAISNCGNSGALQEAAKALAAARKLSVAKPNKSLQGTPERRP